MVDLERSAECPLEILYRDDYLLVVNKPSGLLVHRGWARDKVVAMTLVRDYVGHYVYPVHRIDRSASGAIVMATGPDSARALQGLFERCEITKQYLAILRGIPEETGVIDYPLPRELDGPRTRAITEYRRLCVFERYSVVAARPKTGRTHQIRRHFRHISCPLIGDVRYGKGEHNRIFRTRFNLHRLALHASRIEFIHPVTGEALSIHAPLPPELTSVFEAMGCDPFPLAGINETAPQW